MNIVSLQNIAIGFVAVWTISPPLFASGGARGIVVICVLVWAALEVYRRQRPTRYITLPIFLAAVYLVYVGFMQIVLFGIRGWIDDIQIWIMFFFLIIWQSRRNSISSLLPVFWSVLAISPVWVIITVQTILTDNSRAARIIVRSSDEAIELTRQGVGGYSLVYGTLLLFPVLGGLLLDRGVMRGAVLPRPMRSIPLLADALVAANVVLGVALVLTAGFSIAVIALASISISMVLLRTFSIFRLLITLLTSAILITIGPSLLSEVLTVLMPFAEGTNFANKIRDILVSLDVGEAIGTAEDRTERYMRSIALFYNNPVFGVLAVDDVGKHSEFLDNFARWGVLFGGIFVYLMTFPAVRVMRRSARNFGVGLSMLAAVVVIFGLNNGFAAAGLMIFLMFPISQHMLDVGPRRSRLQNAGGSSA